MKHLPLEILAKIREKTANKIIELTAKYNNDKKIYKKLEALYNNLYKICDIMEEKTGKYEGGVFSDLGRLPKIFVVDTKEIRYEINEDTLMTAAQVKPYYTPAEANALIYWTINNTRDNLKKNMDTNDLTGACGFSQFSSLYPLQKLGLKVTINNIGNVDNKLGRHAFGTVTIPTLVGNVVENRQYLIDCTYSQFFHLDRCVPNMYNPNGRKPDAGYFIKGYKDEEYFVSNMITYGFCEATEKNLKKYFYGMYLSGFEKGNVEEAKLTFNNINISNIVNNVQESFDYSEEEFKEWGYNLDIVNSTYHK